MKLKTLILLSAFGCWMLTSCNNPNNNNNNNNNENDNTTPNSSTMDTSAVNANNMNANANANMNTNDNNNNNNNGTVGADAADFMREAASGGMMEVALGKLALKNSTSADVKAMGQMLITDHTKANDQLKALAAKKGVTLPDSMMDKHKDKYDDAAKLKGKDFDKKFASMSVDDHQDDIDKFTSESKSITDPELLAWIKNTLPTLQKHLTHAKMLDQKYNK
jgi:putative membrane protein